MASRPPVFSQAEETRRIKERAARDAAEKRSQVSSFFSGIGDFFTSISPKAETDAQAKARRAKEKKEREAETAAAVARNQAAAKQRAAANTPTAEEKAFRDARNTRVDRLTDEQRRLIKQGRPDTPQEAAARRAATQSAAAEVNKNRGGQGNPATTQNKTGSATRRTGTASTPAANNAGLPAPSTQQQPVLELNVNRDERVRTSGQSISQRFDINSFRSEMLLNDVLPSHSYLVTFAPFRQNFSENVPLTSFVSEKRNTLMLRCENIVLPAPSLLEEENVRRYGYGPVEKIPYGVQFGDVTMTWVVDKNSEIIDFFHQWMNTIVMHDSKNASIGPGTTRNGLSKYRPFEVGYKDGYTNPIVRIYVYNRQQETVTEYEMYDVFPMNIQAMNLSWTDENQVQKLTVTFAYTNMSMGAPQKTPTQFNFYETLIDAVSPYEHFEYVDSLQKFADEAASPNGESIRRTVNASRPNATEPVQPPPILADLEGSPTVRNFTNIA